MTSIASVSGGSLANATLASRLDFTAPEADVEKAVGEVGKRISALPVVLSDRKTRAYVLVVCALGVTVGVGWWWLPLPIGLRAAALLVGLVLAAGLAGLGITGGGTLFGWWGTWAYLLALLVLAEGVVVGFTELLDWSLAAELGVIAAGLLLVSWLASLRGRVTWRTFAHTLFANGPSTRLDALHGGLDHVVCATDLHAGHHVYFSSGFVCGYGFGLGHDGSLPLHVPAQASAAFPGAFPLRSVKRSRFGFRRSNDGRAGLLQHARAQARRRRGLRQHGRSMGPGTGKPHEPVRIYFRRATEVVVVSASAALGRTALPRLWLPILRELMTLLRDKSVLYDNGNSARRRELVARFDFAEKHPPGLRGTLVHIEQSPFRVPELLRTRMSYGRSAPSARLRRWRSWRAARSESRSGRKSRRQTPPCPRHCWPSPSMTPPA